MARGRQGEWQTTERPSSVAFLLRSRGAVGRAGVVGGNWHGAVGISESLATTDY